jgi:hypothetical protein
VIRVSKIIKDPCADVNRATGTTLGAAAIICLGRWEPDMYRDVETAANEITQKYAQERFPGESLYSDHPNFHFINLEV